MRHLQLVCLLAATAALFACTDDELFTIGRTDEPLTPEVMDARTFFENRIATADQDGTLDLDSYLAPGEVTPVWQKAVVTRTGNEEQVWVPFESDWSYQVRVIVEFKDGSADYRSYPVRQVLLISRGLAGNTCQASYVTLTPTRDYHLKHRSNVLNNFLSKPDHGEYSGMAFYYDAATMEPWKLEEYKKGAVSFSSTRQSCNVDFSWVMFCMTKQFEYRRARIIFTKSGSDSFEFSEENGWMDMFCEEIYKEGDYLPYNYWVLNSVNGGLETRSFSSEFIRAEKDYCTWSSSYEQSISNFPKQSVQSDNASCLPNCLSYLHSIQTGNYSYTASATYEDQLKEYYHDTYDDKQQEKFAGVTTEHTAQFFNDIANRGDFEISQMTVRNDCSAPSRMNYDNQLEQNNYIVTNVFMFDPDGTKISCHAVVIVGKNQKTGEYVYRDPSKGKFLEGPGVIFGTEFSVAIKISSTSK